jgi:hypothetical protein
LAKLEMRTTGNVLSFDLELLGQDEEARKKHHSLHTVTVLDAAKIIIDGTKEVQQIRGYLAENLANGPTMGATGIAIGDGPRSVGANGRLMDGSGFAAAGITHENEYVLQPYEKFVRTSLHALPDAEHRTTWSRWRWPSELQLIQVVFQWRLPQQLA